MTDIPWLSPARQAVLVAAVAIVILGLIGLVFRAVSSSSPPTPEAMAEGGSNEWPTPRPSPTATASPTPGPTLAPTPTATPLPTPTPIVIGWRELGTLISIEYTLQTVVEVQRERVFPLSPERIILAAVGNVEAGIDLTQIEAADVLIEGARVQVMLPPAAVTSVELLPDQSTIYDSRRGWILSEYAGLEIEAMQQARTQLEDWAINRADLLNKAEELAQAQLEAFLRQLGFEEIEITFKR